MKRYSDIQYTIEQRHRQFLHFYLTEARYVHRIFDDVLYDIADTVREEIQSSRLRYEDREQYTGWCYDNATRKVLRSDRPDKFHPIYIIYEYNEDDFGICYAYDRIISGKSKEELEHDDILIGFNLASFYRDGVNSEELLEDIEQMLGHEFTHVKDMWHEQYRNILSDERRVEYTRLTPEFYKNVNWEVSGDDLKMLSMIFGIFSIGEIDAISSACDKFIHNKNNHEKIIDVISDGNTEDEKAEFFIDNFDYRFGFWKHNIFELLRHIKQSYAGRDAGKFALLFAQTSVVLGFSEDKTGGYMSSEEDWSYINAIVARERPADRRTADTVNAAIDAFVEKSEEYICRMKDTVIDCLNEYGLIKDSKVFESKYTRDGFLVETKTKYCDNIRDIGCLELWNVYDDGDEFVRSIREHLIEKLSMFFDEEDDLRWESPMKSGRFNQFRHLYS